MPIPNDATDEELEQYGTDGDRAVAITTLSPSGPSTETVRLPIKRGSDSVSIAKRREYVLWCRVNKPRWTNEEIALAVRDRFGSSIPDNYNADAVSKDVQRALKPVRENIREYALELVAMDNYRLEEMYTRLEEVAYFTISDESGGPAPGVNMAAIDRMLKVMQRRSQLLGLDAPDFAALSQIALEEDDEKFLDDAQRFAALTAIIEQSSEESG